MTIEEIGREHCSGCSLCTQVCGKQCIRMEADKEGFLMPVIDHDACVDCGACYKLCPSAPEHAIEETQPVYYASAIADKEDLLHSSSGGTFIALAKWMISQGGYVCGCVFDTDMKAVHVCTTDMDVVRSMRGSKYVQSSIEAVLPQVKALVKEGKKVLFTGTACQVAAVKAYVRDHSNLYLVDILCHGVPSPLFLRKYKDALESKHRGKLVRLEFRNKEKLGWGSEHRTYYEIEKNGKVTGYRPALPAYFCSFFWGIDLRESCYNCKFAGPNRISDITIGDFWGYWSYYHKNFPEGISISSVNTERGREMMEAVKPEMDFFEIVPPADAKGTNTNFYHPTPRPAGRNGFYDGIYEKPYSHFIKRTLLDRSSRKKMLRSLYGRFVPKFIRSTITGFRQSD